CNWPRSISSRTRTLADGGDFATINHKGYVPMLELDNGERLTEVAVILVPGRPQVRGGAGAAGRLDRAHMAAGGAELHRTELHKFYSPWLFHPEVGETAQADARSKIASRF